MMRLSKGSKFVEAADLFIEQLESDLKELANYHAEHECEAIRKSTSEIFAGFVLGRVEAFRSLLSDKLL